MKLLMRDEAKGKEHTIFVTIFAALMVMLVIMVMLMASAMGSAASPSDWMRTRWTSSTSRWRTVPGILRPSSSRHRT